MSLGALTGALSTALSAVSTQIQDYFTDRTKRNRHFVFPALTFVLACVVLLMVIVGPGQLYAWYTGLALSVQALVGALLALLFILLTEATRHLTLTVRRLYSGEWLLPERTLRMAYLKESHRRVRERGIFKQAEARLSSASDILESLGAPPGEVPVVKKKEYPVLRHPLEAYQLVTGGDWCWKEMEEITAEGVITTPEDLVARYALMPLPAGEPITADKVKSSPGAEFHGTDREVLTLNVHPTEIGPWLSAGAVVDLHLTSRDSTVKSFKKLLVLDHPDDEQVVLSVSPVEQDNLLKLLPDCDVTFTRRTRNFQSSADEGQPAQRLVAIPVVKGVKGGKDETCLTPGQLIQREHIHWREPRDDGELPGEELCESDLVGKVYWPSQLDEDPAGPAPELSSGEPFRKCHLLKGGDGQPKTVDASWLSYQKGGKTKYRRAFRVFVEGEDAWSTGGANEPGSHDDDWENEDWWGDDGWGDEDWGDQSLFSKKGRARHLIRTGDRVIVEAYGKVLADWCYVYNVVPRDDPIHYLIAVKDPQALEDKYEEAKKNYYGSRRKRTALETIAPQDVSDELVLSPFHSVPVLKEATKSRRLIAPNQISERSYYADSDEVSGVCVDKSQVVDHYVAASTAPSPHRPIPLQDLRPAIPSTHTCLSLEKEKDLSDRVIVEDAGGLREGDLVSIKLASPYGDSPDSWAAACVRHVTRDKSATATLTGVELAILGAYQKAQELWDAGATATVTVAERGWARFELDEALSSARIESRGTILQGLTPGTLVTIGVVPESSDWPIWLDACVCKKCGSTIELATPQSDEADQALALLQEGAEVVITAARSSVEWTSPVRKERIETIGASLDDPRDDGARDDRWGDDALWLIQPQPPEPAESRVVWATRVRLQDDLSGWQRVYLTLVIDEPFQEIRKALPQEKLRKGEAGVAITAAELRPNLVLDIPEEEAPTLPERVRRLRGRLRVVGDTSKGVPDLPVGTPVLIALKPKSCEEPMLVQAYSTYSSDEAYGFFVPKSEDARKAKTLWDDGAMVGIKVSRDTDDWADVLVLKPAEGEGFLPHDRVTIKDDFSREVSDFDPFTLMFIEFRGGVVEGEAEGGAQAVRPRARTAVGEGEAEEDAARGFTAYLLRAEVATDPETDRKLWSRLELYIPRSGELKLARESWDGGLSATLIDPWVDDPFWTALPLEPRDANERLSERVTVIDFRALEVGDLVSVELAKPGEEPESPLGARVAKVCTDPDAKALIELQLVCGPKCTSVPQAQALWDKGAYARITVKEGNNASGCPDDDSRPLILRPEPDLARRLTPRLREGDLVSLDIQGVVDKEKTKNKPVRWDVAKVVGAPNYDASGTLTEVKLVNLTNAPLWAAERLWDSEGTTATTTFWPADAQMKAREQDVKERKPDLVLCSNEGKDLSSRVTVRMQRGDLVEMVFTGPDRERETFVWDKAYVGCVEPGVGSAPLTRLELAVPEREKSLAQDLWKKGATATITVTHTDARVQQLLEELDGNIRDLADYLKQFNKVISAEDLPDKLLDELRELAQKSESQAKELQNLHGQMADRPWQGDQPPKECSYEEGQRRLWVLTGQLRSTVDTWTDALERVQRNRQRDIQLALPDSLADTRATRLGNVLAAAADYPRTAYGIDTTTMLPRLLQALEEEDKAVIRLGNAEASMNMLLLFSFWSAVWTLLTGVWSGLGIAAMLLWDVRLVWSDWWTTPLMAAIGLFIFLLTREAGTSQAHAYGEALKSLFDLRRRKLFAVVGLPDLETKEMTPVEEREHWTHLYELFALGDTGAEDFPALKPGGGAEGE